MAQNGSRKGIAGIKARLFQVFKYVIKRRQTNSYFFRDIGPGCLFTITPVTAPQAVLQFDELAELRNTFSRLCRFALCIITPRKHFEQSACSGIALRVNKGVVQWLDAISNLEKACCLHKCGGAETRYLLEFCTRFER